jgi:hypothetical protein
MRLLSPTTASFSYLIVAGYALLGRRAIVEALFLSWLITMLNPGIAPAPEFGSVGRFLVLLAAGASALLHSGILSGQLTLKPMTFWTLLLGGAISLHSMLLSEVVDVSLLKTLSWMLAMAALLSAWAGLGVSDRQAAERFIFLGLVAVAIFSLPLLGTAVGVLRNGTGFQGILNHPQAFGSVMAILASWSISKFLGQTRPDLRLIGTAGFAVSLLFMSEARTGALAAVFGFFAAATTVRFLSGRPLLHLIPGIGSRRVWGGAALAFTVALALSGQIATTIEIFIQKSGRADVESILAAYELSRGGLIEGMTQNIAERPFTGVGFGVASDPNGMQIERDPVFNLPVGAPTEKGVAPIMIVEELGFPLAFSVFIWILMIVRRASNGGLAPLAITFNILALNMGEAMLFSPGGQGLLIMILLSWAGTFRKQVLR